MKILGIAAPFGHDHSAALLIDGRIIAAVEEERFTRRKHADGQMPVNSIKYCLNTAGLDPQDIDYVAYPWSFKALREKRLEYLFRTIWSKPARGYKKFTKNKGELADQTLFSTTALKECGFDMGKTRFEWVEHHMAHVSSAFFFSGVPEAAVLSIDAGGEIVSTLLGYADRDGIFKLKQIIAPDSLGIFTRR